MNRAPRLLEVFYSFDSGGSERVGAALVTGLAERGWQVDIAATHSAEGPMRTALEARGLTCHGLDIERRGRLARRWAVYRLCRRLRPDVLHAQHIPMLLLCYWPARLAGVRRFVVTEHTDFQLRARPGLRRALRAYARRLAWITVIHEGLARYLIDHVGVPAERVRVIPNGVDSRRFAPGPADPGLRRVLGAADERVLIGCVARLHPDKDHETLLRAFARVGASSDGPRPHLALIGEGDARQAILELIDRLGLQEDVTLVGDRADIDRLMPQLDVLALSSRTEGLPMVLLEAMACGVPCVATAVGGIPGLLEPGGGVLVEPGDVDGLAEALARLCRDAPLRRREGARARERVLAEYGEREMIEGYGDALLPHADAAPSGGACRDRHAA